MTRQEKQIDITRQKKSETHNWIKPGLFRGPLFRETLSIIEFQKQKESLSLLSYYNSKPGRFVIHEAHGWRGKTCPETAMNPKSLLLHRNSVSSYK